MIGITPPPGLVLESVRPNPSRNAFSLAFTLPDDAPALIELLDLAGRRLFERELGNLARGRHVAMLPEARALPAGVYLVRLSQNRRSITTRAVVVR